MIVAREWRKMNNRKILNSIVVGLRVLRDKKDLLDVEDKRTLKHIIELSLDLLV